VHGARGRSMAVCDGLPGGADPLASRPIVFLTAVQYDDCLSGRTRRLADGLAALGHDVTFVQMPSVRSTARRVRRLGWDAAAPAVRATGVRVCSVPPLPLHSALHDSALGRRWARAVAERVRAAVPRPESSAVVCSTPWWLRVVERMPYAALVYDCIDHVEVHSGERRAGLYGAWERELMERSAAVLAVGNNLRDAIRSSGSAPATTPMYVVPNGVSRGWVDASPAAPAELSAWTAGAPSVGFVGSVFEWVDQSLLRSASELLADHRFFVVGPTRMGVPTEALRGLANLRVFPAAPFEAVPSWIAGADVCLLPFKPNRVTELADPIKVYEYCALGKPVVSSIPCRVMGEPAPVRVAGDPTLFASAIRQAWQQDSPAERESRRAFARGHTWEARALEVRGVLGEVAAR